MLAKDLLPPQPGSLKPLLTWSVSGKFLAARVGDVYVWNVADGQMIGRLRFSETELPDPIALSSDGLFLAAGKVAKGSPAVGRTQSRSGPFSSAIEIWEVVSGKSFEWPAHSTAAGLALAAISLR